MDERAVMRCCSKPVGGGSETEKNTQRERARQPCFCPFPKPKRPRPNTPKRTGRKAHVRETLDVIHVAVFFARAMNLPA
jgi:hypothetical protein